MRLIIKEADKKEDEEEEEDYRGRSELKRGVRRHIKTCDRHVEAFSKWTAIAYHRNLAFLLGSGYDTIICNNSSFKNASTSRAQVVCSQREIAQEMRKAPVNKIIKINQLLQLRQQSSDFKSNLIIISTLLTRLRSSQCLLSQLA